ncbi:MAG: FAD-dependent oxidoreductase [Proteocatella sp.]|nr:FAD-dependent oxidoreductase [Proteocatella sp.]
MKGYGKKILAIMLAASAAVSGIFGIDAVPAYAQENSDTQDTVMPVSYEEYDVAVFGSDPEGVAAAASAAKNGLRTLLVDFEREAAGGLYTLGWLNMIDFNYAPDNEDSVFDTRFYPENYLNHGIFDRFYKLTGKRKAFDVKQAQRAFETILAESGAEVLFIDDSSFDYSYDSSSRISEITLCKDTDPLNIRAKVVIDCTPNAEIAMKAGARFLEGKEDRGFKNQYQATTLVFKIDGIDWDSVRDHLKYDGDPKTGANGTSAWGYEEMFNCPVDNPKMQMRGLNLGLQDDGTVLVNAFQIFDMNPYDKAADELIRLEARERILKDVIPYMRENLTGFENAELVDVAPEFYFRETRHLVAKDTLTAEAVFDNVFPKNFIASGSYPIDIQAKKKGDSGTILSGTRPYGITAGMMIPQDVDGIFVASKCAGFDSVAFGSARTVPVLMGMGEAAGVMSKVIIENSISVSEMAENDKLLLQTRNMLFDQGVRLVAYQNSNPIEESYAKEQIRYMRSRALLSMNYDNDYRLDERASYQMLDSMLYLIENNSKSRIDRSLISDMEEGSYVELEDMIAVAGKAMKRNFSSLEGLKNSYVISESAYREIMDKDEFTNEDMYCIMAGIVRRAV